MTHGVWGPTPLFEAPSSLPVHKIIYLSHLLHSISELRDYSGCILFEEYQVGLLVQDLTKIIALRPGEEGPCSTVPSTPMYVGLPSAYCYYLLLHTCIGQFHPILFISPSLQTK